MLDYIIVGLGGFIGSIFRFSLGKILPGSVFEIPIPILFVNILGCFLIGILSEIVFLNLPESKMLKMLLVPGILGGFTTFSSFVFEFGKLWNEHTIFSAVFYLFASVFLSILFFFIGTKIVNFCG